MTFKVGDKVRITNFKVKPGQRSPGVTEEMKGYFWDRKVYTVQRVLPNELVCIHPKKHLSYLSSWLMLVDKAIDDTPYSAVMSKITSLENSRKEKGYAF